MIFMINKEKYLQRLRTMDPCAVAAIVEKALKDAGIECSKGKTEILFDGLIETSQISFESSTIFASGRVNTCNVFYSYTGSNEVISNCINVEKTYTTTDFGMTNYELAA